MAAGRGRSPDRDSLSIPPDLIAGRNRKGIDAFQFRAGAFFVPVHVNPGVRWLRSLKRRGSAQRKQEIVVDKEHIKGAAKKAKGAMKEAAGKMTNNKSLEREGKADKAKGAAHKALGDVKDAVRKAS
jgi:uncharacterized protein YjbJ (UPF0337 family)